MDALPGLCECAALLAIGFKMRSSGIVREGDGLTALKVATCLILPSVIVKACT